MFLFQFAIVLLCILIGARIGGIGLGVMGGFGLAILTFGFNLQPTSPPIDVMLMIMAVVSAAAAMQAAGGLNYMIQIATRILRKNPKYITFIAPAVVIPPFLIELMGRKSKALLLFKNRWTTIY